MYLFKYKISFVCLCVLRQLFLGGVGHTHKSKRTGQGRLEKEVLLTTLLLKRTATAAGEQGPGGFFFSFRVSSSSSSSSFHFPLFLTIGIAGATTMQSRRVRQALSR